MLNINVFNLISRINEIRHIKWHETCKCKCRLDASVCNNKQRWNKDKCWCECKELIDKGMCDKGFIWDPSNCGCQCDKLCYVGEYSDYKNCTCRKKLIDNLVLKNVVNIDGNKMIFNDTLNDDQKVSNFCTVNSSHCFFNNHWHY